MTFVCSGCGVEKEYVDMATYQETSVLNADLTFNKLLDEKFVCMDCFYRVEVWNGDWVCRVDHE